MLELKNVSLRYDNKEILKNVSLSLEKGEVLTIIGPSGGGKTSLLKICALLTVPTSGDVFIDNEQCIKDGNLIINPHSIWPKVTLIFQQLYLWPHLSARENIELPHKNPRSIEQKLSELGTLFGLTQHLDKYPNELSSGQKQRVAIVRALLVNPKYILMDEITAALDVEQTFNTLGLISTLRSSDVGIIVVTHHLEFAKKISDKIIFIEEGSLVDTGGPEMIDSPKNGRVAIFVNKLNTIK